MAPKTSPKPKRKGVCPDLLKGTNCRYDVGDCWYDQHPAKIMTQVFCTNKDCVGYGCGYNHTHRLCRNPLHAEGQEIPEICPFNHKMSETPCPVAYAGERCNDDCGDDECWYSHLCPDLSIGRVCHYDSYPNDGICEFDHPSERIEAIECDRMRRGESCGERCDYDHAKSKEYPCKYGNNCKYPRTCALRHERYPCIGCKRWNCKQATRDHCVNCSRMIKSEQRIRNKVKAIMQDSHKHEESEREHKCEEESDDDVGTDDESLADLVAAFGNI